MKNNPKIKSISFGKKINSPIQKKRNDGRNHRKNLMVHLFTKFRTMLNQFRKVKNQENVKSLKKVDTLLLHEKNQRVKELPNSTRAMFSVVLPIKEKTVTMPGLTVKLKEIFYPYTEDNPWLKSKDNKKKRKIHRNYRPSKTSSLCVTHGCKHGTLVHNQIEKFTNIMTLDSLPKDIHFQKLISWFSDTDTCVIRILLRCFEESWLPICSEFKIWDEKIWTQTSVDLIVFDVLKLKLNIIEMKTGYEDEEYGPHPNDDPLPPPFNDIKNCPKNRHMLQLGAMRIMLKKAYGITPDGCYLMRALPKTKGTSLISIAPWVKEKMNADSLYQILRQ